MNKNFKTFMLKIALCVACSFPLFVLAKSSASIGDAAESLTDVTAIVTKLVHIACYIVGTALILGSVAQYKNHKQNPKLVPLTTPITLLILGVLGVMIPYGTKIFGESYSAEERAKASQDNRLMLLPTEKKPGLTPLGSKPAENVPPQQGQDYPAQQEPYAHPEATPDTAPAESGDSGSSGGGWTSDPRYN